MVMNFSALRSGDIELVKMKLESIVSVTRKNKVVSKVIIETCYLTREEKITTCQPIVDARATRTAVRTS